MHLLELLNLWCKSRIEKPVAIAIVKGMRTTTYRNTQFCTTTTDTSSITMGTGQLLNINPSNDTKEMLDIGLKICLKSSRLVLLAVQFMITAPATPTITRPPSVPSINCIIFTTSSWYVPLVSDSVIHLLAVSPVKDVTLFMKSSSSTWLSTWTLQFELFEIVSLAIKKNTYHHKNDDITDSFTTPKSRDQTVIISRCPSQFQAAARDYFLSWWILGRISGWSGQKLIANLY